MTPIRKELQDSLEESGNDYKLKTDDEIIDMIIDFGCGETEFHTVDINRIIVENQRMKALLNIKEI
jgi:hypothetical protein